MIARTLKHAKTFKYVLFKVLFSLGQDAKQLQGALNNRRSDDLLLVANGPSLNNTPVESFNCDSMGLNKINLFFNKSSWRPNYIVVTNGLVMRQSKQFFTSTGISVFAEFKAKLLGLKSDNISYFLTRPRRVFTDDVVGGVGASGTVTYAALQIAARMGYKRIFIVGMDHNFEGYSPAKKNAPSIERFQGDDVNHFDPNYFKNQKWGVPNLYDSELGYSRAKEWTDARQIKIYDCTIGGKCTIFPKISVESALNLIGEK